MLKVGQPVNMKDHGSAVSLSFFDHEVPLNHMVVEVSDEYVIDRDIARVKETTVPVHAVKAVEKVRTKLE